MFQANNIHIRGQSQTFNETTHGNINHLNIYNNYSQRLQGFVLLLENVATEAFHNSGQVSDPPKCHPGTRVAILDSLHTWAAALAYVIAFKWVHGPAGAGKSAIMRTLAEMLEKCGLLLATFFFFRASTNRNSTQFFIPTITYQICLAIPAFKPLVESAIEAHPLIFSQSLETQARLLIVKPLSHLHETGALPPCHPRIIIIDGLDECLDPDRQIEVLQILTIILSELSIPFAIIVASRPEPHIRAAFDNGELNQLSSRLVLDDSYKPDTDVRKFFEDKFFNIRTTHRLRAYLPNPWPLPATLDLLVKQASGQFAFASAVIKFVEPPRHNPAERLDILLSPQDSLQDVQNPFEQLDTLYSTIFYAIPLNKLPKVLRILGVLLVPHLTWVSYHIFSGMRRHTDRSVFFPHSPNHLAFLLGMAVSAIREHLYDLESLLQVKEDGREIEIFHASLADFIFDKFRSGKFYINPAMIHEEICRRCIQFFSSSEPDRIHPGNYREVSYVLYNIRYHLQCAAPTPELLHLVKNQCDINTFPPANILVHSIFPEFLHGVQDSNFPNARTLHSGLVNKYKQYISRRVDLYFKRGLSHLLPLASDNYYDCSYAQRIQVARRGITEADMLPVGVPQDALDLVWANSLGLPLLNLVRRPHEMHLLPRILVMDILGERIHGLRA